MHLKQLKLAGFKSFVEPTIVPFRSQLVAVVGPNGCGKSNIIDAVRWVMGESSAKNLRGESMIDVIFNGSSERKPIGQASVELVFDNSLGRVVGPYASYQEIAVKRLVTRDGDSFYYLNGSRCRRRDITDIFLGTGAGARGYSIIGQDTISRLIEARPEELRAYLEEAAGVSKYKERRRETLQRIHHTRENLARVCDIRDELDKQLLRLERQAKSAQRYTALKQDARLCKAQILALKWRQLSCDQTVILQEISELSLQHERHRTNMTGFLNDNTHLREMLHLANDRLQKTQVKFYELNTDIARLEETIQQQVREKQRMDGDKLQFLSDVKKTADLLAIDQVALGSAEQGLILLQANAQALQVELVHCQQIFTEKEVQKLDWDQEWQLVQTAFNEAHRQADVAKNSLQHLEQQHQHTLVRLDKIQMDPALMALEPLEKELSLLKAQHTDLIQQHSIDTEYHLNLAKKGQALREKFVLIEAALHEAQETVHALSTDHAALFAVQNAALHQVKNDSSALPLWDKSPRLAEVITVSDEWLRACELVLGESLQAIVVDSIASVMSSLAELHQYTAVFIQMVPQSTPTYYPRLSDKIKGPVPCWINGVEQVFAADSLDEATQWLGTLTPQQSIVTRDGYWMGPGWVKIAGLPVQDEKGLLSRQQDLLALTETLKAAKEHLAGIKSERDALHSLVSECDAANSKAQQALSISHENVRLSDADIKRVQQACEHALLRKSTLSEEQGNLLEVIETLLTQKMQLDHQMQSALESLCVQENAQQVLRLTKTAWEDEFTAARRLVDTTRDSAHQAELQYQQAVLKTQQLRDSTLRYQQEMNTLLERLAHLDQRGHELTQSREAPVLLLQEKVRLHHQLETTLGRERLQVDDLQQQLMANESAAQNEGQHALLLQEKIQKQQLIAQQIVVRADGLVEALTALHADVEILLAELPTEITLEGHEATLALIDEKIKCLGAINLVAIEEYQTELIRKQQLDEQYHDLMAALTTLDSAIAKMDKETQLRLKETFDQVNTAFQALFPRLFEGGRARLELTCDNLLEAGVLVIAQPPGKRNGSIHLLSGGEKAMTAVALVFAIFQQNPSPFCMLDEVDAPLDDLNVKRFCNVVKEMSPFVQFLFITHNKVTMELADHLIGVTMREPGVSRIVTVDVETAMAVIAE